MIDVVFFCKKLAIGMVWQPREREKNQFFNELDIKEKKKYKSKL
jgi:hypothetical protein